LTELSEKIGDIRNPLRKREQGHGKSSMRSAGGGGRVHRERGTEEIEDALIVSNKEGVLHGRTLGKRTDWKISRERGPLTKRRKLI